MIIICMSEFCCQSLTTVVDFYEHIENQHKDIKECSKCDFEPRNTRKGVHKESFSYHECNYTAENSDALQVHRI